MTTTVTDIATVCQSSTVSMMKALVFRGPNDIAFERVPMPIVGFGEAVIRVTLTTICGTDLHILKGRERGRSPRAPRRI